MPASLLPCHKHFVEEPNRPAEYTALSGAETPAQPVAISEPVREAPLNRDSVFSLRSSPCQSPRERPSRLSIRSNQRTSNYFKSRGRQKCTVPSDLTKIFLELYPWSRVDVPPAQGALVLSCWVRGMSVLSFLFAFRGGPKASGHSTVFPSRVISDPRLSSHDTHGNAHGRGGARAGSVVRSTSRAPPVRRNVSREQEIDSSLSLPRCDSASFTRLSQRP